MKKPIAYACPLTHHRYGENSELPEEDVEFVFEVLPSIQEKLDAGLCILMEIENPEEVKGSDNDVENVDSNKAIRTGRMAFVSKPMMTQLFGDQGETNRGFVNKEIMDQLEIMAQKLNPGETEEDGFTPFEELSDEQ